MSSSVYGQTQINNDVETILLDIIRENKIEVLQELPKDAACTNQLLKVAWSQKAHIYALVPSSKQCSKYLTALAFHLTKGEKISEANCFYFLQKMNENPFLILPKLLMTELRKIR